MLLLTAFENADRCIQNALAESEYERSRAWRYLGSLWRRFAVEQALMLPDEAAIEAKKLAEIEDAARQLGLFPH